MIATGALIVVADGTSAVFYRNTGLDSIELDKIETITPQDLENEGPSGSTPVEQSLKDLDEATFAKQLVQKLNAMALDNSLPDAVVIVADPRSLGHMRPLYHKELARRVVHELHKTLVKAAPQDVAKALSTL